MLDWSGSRWEMHPLFLLDGSGCMNEMEDTQWHAWLIDRGLGNIWQAEERNGPGRVLRSKRHLLTAF